MDIKKRKKGYRISDNSQKSVVFQLKLQNRSDYTDTQFNIIDVVEEVGYIQKECWRILVLLTLLNVILVSVQVNTKINAIIS